MLENVACKISRLSRWLRKLFLLNNEYLHRTNFTMRLQNYIRDPVKWFKFRRKLVKANLQKKKKMVASLIHTYTKGEKKHEKIL